MNGDNLTSLIALSEEGAVKKPVCARLRQTGETIRVPALMWRTPTRQEKARKGLFPLSPVRSVGRSGSGRAGKAGFVF